MDIRLTELKRGCAAFEKYESRDAMYRVATRLVSDLWPSMEDVADGPGVLMLTWNQAFYRYGAFSFDDLESALRNNQASLEEYRSRSILSFGSADQEPVRCLFKEFLSALQIDADNKKRGTKSPVAVAKALHMIAPGFFPLRDREIAKAYGCNVDDREDGYFVFIERTTEVLQSLEEEYRSKGTEAELPKSADLASALSESSRFTKPILKFLDEYNYARFTKGWI